jgi:phosphoglycerate dehydrogenase-like enzyme
MSKPHILILDWLPDGLFEQLARRWPSMEWIDGRLPATFEQHHATATITYGMPPVARLEAMHSLKWVQLISAGVPQELCPVALRRNLTVTNLSGLYGPTIGEHALAMLTFLARNLHTVVRNQQQAKWDRSVMHRLTDLAGQGIRDARDWLPANRPAGAGRGPCFPADRAACDASRGGSPRSCSAADRADAGNARSS